MLLKRKKRCRNRNDILETIYRFFEDFFPLNTASFILVTGCFPFLPAQDLCCSPHMSCAVLCGYRSSGASVRDIHPFSLLIMEWGLAIIDAFSWVFISKCFVSIFFNVICFVVSIRKIV